MSTVSYDDFTKLDIRTWCATETIEGKSRIIKGKIDLGNDDQRDVIIGGAQILTKCCWKNCNCPCKFGTKKMAGVESNAMLLQMLMTNHFG